MGRIDKNYKKVGRPSIINHKDLVEICLRRKDEIISEGGLVISKNAPIWSEIVDELRINVKPVSIYTKITTDSNLLHTLRGYDCEEMEMDEEISVTSSNNSTLLSEEEDDSCLSERQNLKFETKLSRKMYSKISETHVNPKTHQLKTKFTRYKWENYMQNKIYAELRKMKEDRKCAIHFKNHYLGQDAKTGNINGEIFCLKVLSNIIFSINRLK